jgi:hypothetical protein
MLYPWPFLGFDALFDDALRIAMDYLERTGQAAEYTKVQSLAAAAIVAQWRAGARHKIRLANHAINAVEKDRGPRDHLESFYPRVG